MIKTNKTITIDLDFKQAEDLSDSLSDILCFAAGVKAATDEYDNRFSLLINACDDLRHFSYELKKVIINKDKSKI